MTRARREERAPDLNQLALGERQVANARRRRNVETDLIKHGARLAHEFTATDCSGRRARQPAGENIFSDCLIRKLAQFLMDNDDPRIQGVAGFMGSESLAPQLDRPLIGLMDAGQYFHERRFAGAVLADDAEHLALIERIATLG